MSLKDQILSSNDLAEEVVPCPEWGEGVEIAVRTMTGTARGQLEAAQMDDKVSLADFKAALVVASCYEPGANGTLLFSPEDIPALQRKSSNVINRLADVALRLSGFTDSDVEDLAKN